MDEKYFGVGVMGSGSGSSTSDPDYFFLSAPEEMDDKYFGVGVAGSRGHRGLGVIGVSGSGLPGQGVIK